MFKRVVFYSDLEKELQNKLQNNSPKYNELIHEYARCLIELENVENSIVNLMPKVLKRSKYHKEKLSSARKAEIVQGLPSEFLNQKIIDSTSQKHKKRAITAHLNEQAQLKSTLKELTSSINELAREINNDYERLGRVHRVSTTEELKSSGELTKMKFDIREEMRQGSNNRPKHR